jgi:hypothetical protein
VVLVHGGDTGSTPYGTPKPESTDSAEKANKNSYSLPINAAEEFDHPQVSCSPANDVFEACLANVCWAGNNIHNAERSNGLISEIDNHFQLLQYWLCRFGGLPRAIFRI